MTALRTSTTRPDDADVQRPLPSTEPGVTRYARWFYIGGRWTEIAVEARATKVAGPSATMQGAAAYAALPYAERAAYEARASLAAATLIPPAMPIGSRFD